MATEKKIYVVLDVSVKKIYDTKIKAKVVAGMMKSGNAAINKNKKLATSKPSGWKKETDKGFNLKANLSGHTAGCLIIKWSKDKWVMISCWH